MGILHNVKANTSQLALWHGSISIKYHMLKLAKTQLNKIVKKLFYVINLQLYQPLCDSL